MIEKMIEVGKFSCEVGLNIGTQIILQHATDRESYYVITPSLNFVANTVYNILSATSSFRRIGNRGGTMYKKSIKRQSRHTKTAKKNKRYKKSSKKNKRYKKSSKKNKRHKKSSKKYR